MNKQPYILHLNIQQLIIHGFDYDNNKTISGFIIAKNSPFNIKHTIPAGTQLTGFDWIKKEKTNLLKTGQIALIRIRSWWSENIYCSGEIRTEVSDKNLNNILNDVLTYASKYDYVERNFGFFKYQQENLHKSNVYSIKIENSGLNPETNTRKYYTQDFVLNDIEKYLNENNDINYMYDNNNDKFYKFNQDQMLRQKLAFKMLNTADNIVDFNEVANAISGWVFDEEVNLYYLKSEDENRIKINKVKADMRKLLEDAIRNSVKRYMPANTNLWKIIYTGK